VSRQARTLLVISIAACSFAVAGTASAIDFEP